MKSRLIKAVYFFVILFLVGCGRQVFYSELKVEVDYNTSIYDAVVVGNYDLVDSCILLKTQLNEKLKKGKEKTIVHAIRFIGGFSSKEILEETKKTNLRPVNIYEFLAFGSQYPSFQKTNSVIMIDSNRDYNDARIPNDFVLGSDWKKRRSLEFLEPCCRNDTNGVHNIYLSDACYYLFVYNN